MKWKRQEISQTGYREYLAQFREYSVVDIYHTQDSLIWIDIKNQTSSHKTHTLMIEADWVFSKNGEIIESSSVNEGEDDHQYYQRLRDFCQKIAPTITQITELTFEAKKYEGAIIFNPELRFEIHGNKYGLITIKNDIDGSYLISSADPEPNFYFSYTEKNEG